MAVAGKIFKDETIIMNQKPPSSSLYEKEQQNEILPTKKSIKIVAKENIIKGKVLMKKKNKVSSKIKAPNCKLFIIFNLSNFLIVHTLKCLFFSKCTIKVGFHYETL